MVQIIMNGGTIAIIHRYYLYGRGINIELFEDGERLFVELIADCNISNVWSVVVVQPVDVLHDTSPVSLDGRQNEQVLEVSVKIMPPAQKGLITIKMTTTLARLLRFLQAASLFYNLCSLKTELSSTIFSSSSISSLGRSAVMKALTVTDTSSGSWVSDRAVCTT